MSDGVKRAAVSLLGIVRIGTTTTRKARKASSQNIADNCSSQSKGNKAETTRVAAAKVISIKVSSGRLSLNFQSGFA